MISDHSYTELRYAFIDKRTGLFFGKVEGYTVTWHQYPIDSLHVPSRDQALGTLKGLSQNPYLPSLACVELTIQSNVGFTVSESGV